ncbi:MAG: tRNA (cytidine(34)-2'-O)-methyltransferase [Deltaproteobacteria bacterium]|nr:MAG: tRNA (cytidine(34)-2'-O)-methyltransferase [Deltaproteobacteria bacterium]
MRAHVVLVEPEIPQNTGNVARLCAGVGAWLHLVRPLGYRLEDRYVRRAGLDYWPAVRLSVHESVAAVLPLLPEERVSLFTTRAGPLYTDGALEPGSVLVFGRESTGLPEEVLEAFSGREVRIPTTGDVRSLNLGNCVSVGLYEVVRRAGWRGESPLVGPAGG